MYGGWGIDCVWIRGTKTEIKQNKEIEKKYGNKRGENGLDGGRGGGAIRFI